MNMLDVLRDWVNDIWIMDFEEFVETLDFNAIAFELVHEENQPRCILSVIKIADDYFMVIEDTDYDHPVEVKHVKPQVVTKTEYIEL